MDVVPPDLLHPAAATAFAVVGAVLVAVWWQERTHGLRWAAAGYALAFADALGVPTLAFPADAFVVRGLVAWGVGAYLGAAPRWRAALVAPPLIGVFAPPALALWLLPVLDLVIAVLCRRAARRERGSGHALLALAALASATAFAVALVVAPAGALAARCHPATLLAFGIVLAVAALMREHRSAQSARAAMQRMTNFYDALSRTNQAIVRIKDRTELFQAICRICVEAGHASMACVYVLDGALAWRAATAGPAAEMLAGIPVPWDTSQPQARGSYTVQALESGLPVASNDYQNDPRAVPWRAEAARAGVHAFAWLPFHRRGGVDGVLMLAAATPGFFDAPLMKLLEKLVGDISLALDAIDQSLERERAEREAQASLERFQLLFNVAPMPSSILSIAERRVLAVNDACCAAFGMTREEMLGQRTVDLPTRLSAEDREAFYAALRRDGRVRNRIYRLHRSDGSSRHELINAEPIEYLGQACLLLLSLDITELEEAERAREALARSEAASRAKTEFLSRMSHELRTPLNAVLGFTQLLRHDARARLTPQELSQLDLVQQAGWHLLTLINDVLDVSRIESGHLAVLARPLALAPLLDEALQMNRDLAQRHGVTVRADYRGAPPFGAQADPTRLRQVVLNLLSNALKYNRPGGSVRLALEADPATVHLLVEDTGLGMTGEQLAHLYEPFNRLGRERGAVEGTGIGLVLTRQLLRLMQGEIEVQSEIGRGTRVRVSLPRADAPVSTAAPPTAPPEPAAPHGVVLYVEDNEVNALLVEQLLARWAGVRFVHAHDGRSGVDLARTLQPDLLLLDMQLPDIDGLEVIRRIKADPATRHLRVVALSASAMPDDMHRAQELGAEEYWTKPLAFERFLTDMARLIGSATAELRRPC